MQRAAIMPVLNFLFRRGGLLERQVRSQTCVSIEFRTEFLAAGQIELRQLHGRNFLGLDAFSKFGDGQVKNLFAGHRTPQGFVGWVFMSPAGAAVFFSRSISGFKCRAGSSEFSIL